MPDQKYKRKNFLCRQARQFQIILATPYALYVCSCSNMNTSKMFVVQQLLVCTETFLTPTLSSEFLIFKYFLLILQRPTENGEVRIKMRAVFEHFKILNSIQDVSMCFMIISYILTVLDFIHALGIINQLIIAQVTDN